MSFSARCLPAILLTILSLPASLNAQSTPKQTTKTPRGSISGRVTIKERGAPGVVVTLRKSEIVNPFEPVLRTKTDPDGFYSLNNLASGSYDVTPIAPAYVNPEMKDARAKSVLVGEDENVDSINFTLIRGAVITGRVTDADGRAIIQQEVTVFAANAFDQTTPQRPAFRTASAMTDDRGIYRIFGLMPGRYKVAAGRSDDAFNPSFGPARAIYRQVFHPDVTDQSKATVIDASEGSEATNVDITLGRALQNFTAMGRVVDGEKGLPVPNVRLGMQRSLGQRFEYLSSFAVSNSQGDFVIEGLIPGKYGVFLLPNQGNETRAETLMFDVIDQDVTGLIVKITKGASVSGVVIIETEDKAVLGKLSELQLRGYVAPAGGVAGIGSGATSAVAPDGSFRLGGLPGGTLNLSVGAANSPFPPKGLSIARIERDGMITPRGIEIKEGEQLTNLRVILSYGTATLRGIVKLENGVLPEGARIMVNLRKPGENYGPMRPPQVDARGHFLIEGIAAGTYELSASVYTSSSPTTSVSARREVAVQDGVVTDVMLTIDMSSPRKPQP